MTAQIIAICVGVLIVAGAWVSGFVRAVRKVGQVLMAFSPGSSVLNRTFDDKAKDLIARVVIVVIGCLIVIIAVLSALVPAK